MSHSILKHINTQNIQTTTKLAALLMVTYSTTTGNLKTKKAIQLSDIQTNELEISS